MDSRSLLLLSLRVRNQRETHHKNHFMNTFATSSAFQPSVAGDLDIRAELRKQLIALPYRSFLQTIIHLLERQGATGVCATGRKEFVGRNRTGGWDIEATLPEAQSVSGRLAGSRCIVQVKQFDRLAVQQRTVDELRGCCLRAGSGQGLLVTLSRFSPVARRAALASPLAPIGLIDGDQLLTLLLVYRLGIKSTRAGIWRIDAEYFRFLSALTERVEEAKQSQFTPRFSVKQPPSRESLLKQCPIDVHGPRLLRLSITLNLGTPSALWRIIEEGAQ